MIQPETDELSVFIIAKNESSQILECLRSVSWAKEIIVVDSQSDDGTPELCQAFGAKVHVRPFQNYSDQKNFAFSKVKTQWALSLDADETVPFELKEEVLKIIQANNSASGYKIPRKSKIFGKFLNFSGTQHDKPIRLIKAGTASFVQPIHEHVEVQGEVGETRNHLIHLPYKNVDDYLSKLRQYTSREAEYCVSKQKTCGSVAVFFLTWGKFFQRYIFHQGFRDGLPGFAFSWLSASYEIVKQIKIREILERKQSQ